MSIIDGVGFQCYGVFYEWCEGGIDYAKRALLEIGRADVSLECKSDLLLSSDPDAVVVMMNPGSLKPLAGYTGPEWAGRLVPAKPDAVQTQIMRLMVAAGWRRVRVVNLADVRAVRSADLYSLINIGAEPLALGAIFENASIVAPEAAIGAAPVICAWGVDKRLATLAYAADCWLRKRGNPLLGVPKPTAGFPAWRYPKPVGNWCLAVAWLEALRVQVKPFMKGGFKPEVQQRFE